LVADSLVFNFPATEVLATYLCSDTDSSTSALPF
jgi:hypothetical protein